MKGLKEKHILILSFIAQNESGRKTSEIRELFPNLPKQNVNHYVAILKEKEYIKEDDSFYTITPKGIGALTRATAKEPIKQSSIVSRDKGHKPKILLPNKQGVSRQESMLLKYPLRTKLDASAPAILISKLGYHEVKLEAKQKLQEGEFERTTLNHIEIITFQIYGLTAMLNNSSLEIYAPHIYIKRSTPSIIAQAEAKKILDPLALKLEKQLNEHYHFDLIRLPDGTLYSERIDVELEEEDHELAKAKPKDYKFEVHNPEDNRVRATIDYSRGKDRPEIALKHRLTAPQDRDTLNEQFNALFDHYASLLDIPRNKEAIEDIKRLMLLKERYEQEDRLQLNDRLKNLMDITAFLLKRAPEPRSEGASEERRRWN